MPCPLGLVQTTIDAARRKSRLHSLAAEIIFLACNPARLKEPMECTAVQIYDPDAKPQLEN